MVHKETLKADVICKYTSFFHFNSSVIFFWAGENWQPNIFCCFILSVTCMSELYTVSQIKHDGGEN